MIRQRRDYRRDENTTTEEPNLGRQDILSNLTELLSNNLTQMAPPLEGGGVPGWVVALLTLLILAGALFVVYINWYYTLRYKYQTSAETEQEWHER